MERFKMNTIFNNQQKKLWFRALLVIVFSAIYIPVWADDFNKYVGESFYLPFPKLSLSNAAIYDYNYESSTHISIINQNYGEAKISSYFTGSEYVTCNIYYYIQSPSGYRTFGHTIESHRVSCKNNNITLSAPKSEINIDEGVQLTHYFDNSYFATNAQVTYSVSSASPSGCVSVSYSGYVKGLSAGTATIQAKSNLSNNVSSVTIRVRKIDPKSVSITPNPASVYCDATLQMYASVSPNGASQSVTWSLYDGNSSTASINSNGLVTGYMPGVITVKATAENGVYDLRTVTVKEPSFTRESSIPSNNATGQNVFITPSVTYSHSLYKGDNFDNITLKSASGENISGTAKMSGKSIVFTPARPLLANTKYTLTIPANSVKNKWGTYYSNSVTIVFTTGNLEKLTLSASTSNKFVKEGTAVTLTASKSNAAIFYTLDGATPSEKCLRYTNPIVINNDVELNAIAVLEGYENSEILHNSYIISNMAVLSKFPNDENPLFNYYDVNPCITFSNGIVASAHVEDMILKKNDTERVEGDVIVADSSIFFVPKEPLELGCSYQMSIPTDAVQSWQGESNKAVSWTFVTGKFATEIAIGGPELASAIKTDGTLLTWGKRYQSGNSSDGSYSMISKNAPSAFVNNSNARLLSSGYMHHALIKNDNTLWMWGRQYCGEFGNNSKVGSANPVKVMDNVAFVSAGGQSTAIIKTDGTLWMCGRNDFGQIGDNSIITRISPVKIMDDVVYADAGWCVTYAIKKDGSLWAWGRNDNSLLGNGKTDDSWIPVKIMNDVVAVDASATQSQWVAVIKKDGSLWVWGSKQPTPQKMLDDVCSIAVGSDYVEAVKTDGTLWAFGNNSFGQLGDGTTINASTPRKVMDNVATVASGGQTTMALLLDGSVWTWGRNSDGTLGNNTEPSSTAYQTAPGIVVEGRSSAVLNDIAARKSTFRMAEGAINVINALPVPLNAIYSNITWNSKNVKVASVTERGVVTAESLGETDITATIRDYKGDEFVKTFHVIVAPATKIELVETEKLFVDKTVIEIARYNLNGQLIPAPQRGVNIIRYSDGTTKKVIVK